MNSQDRAVFTNSPMSFLENTSRERVAILTNKRKQLLNSYRKKQIFRVTIGKGRKWVNYENFNAAYNLREILNDEIVIEFDHDDKNLCWEGINFTAVNLHAAGISFSIWSHEGRSPHLHVHNLDINHLNKDNRKKFKEVFIRTYVPEEYLEFADFSLCGIHMIAIEWAEHWKGHGVKELINRWGENDDTP